MPAGANATDKSAPFFIDTTGLDFKTAPPTRDPHNPNYPKMTELADGTLPRAGAEGNFIVGPTHTPAPEIVAKDGVPKGRTITFTMSSKDSVIYNPGVVRDDPPNCTNGSINATATAPGDKLYLPPALVLFGITIPAAAQRLSDDAIRALMIPKNPTWAIAGTARVPTTELPTGAAVGLVARTAKRGGPSDGLLCYLSDIGKEMLEAYKRKHGIN